MSNEIKTALRCLCSCLSPYGKQPRSKEELPISLCAFEGPHYAKLKNDEEANHIIINQQL